MVRKGLPSSIIKKYGVTKKAWQVFRSRHSRSSLKHYTKSAMRKARHSKPKTRRIHTMVRRRFGKRRGHSAGILRTVEKLTKIGAVAAPAIRSVGEVGFSNPVATGKQLIWNYTGVRGDGTWESGKVIQAATPVLAVYVGWKIFHKLNKMLH